MSNRPLYGEQPMRNRHRDDVGDSDALPLDPVVESYKRHVDRTLLRQNLRRSVTERVANLAALRRLAEEARRAGRSRENPT